MNGRITNIFEIQMFFGKEAFQKQWFLLFIFTCLCPLSCLSFNYFHLDSFLTNPKSMPTSFCFFPLCLHEKSVMFLYWTRLVDTRSINVASKRRSVGSIPWKSRIFHPRILELVRLRANLPFGLWKSLTELEEKFCWFKGR